MEHEVGPLLPHFGSTRRRFLLGVLGATGVVALPVALSYAISSSKPQHGADPEPLEALAGSTTSSIIGGTTTSDAATTTTDASTTTTSTPAATTTVPPTTVAPTTTLPSTTTTLPPTTTAVATGSPPTILAPSSVNAGGTLTVWVEGYVPGETVTFILHSDALIIGTSIVDPSGNAGITAKIPLSFPTGPHRLEVVGTITASTDRPIDVHAAASSTPTKTTSSGATAGTLPATR
ncbi:MAG: sialidase [Ilumatobacteraceae bacterium]|nr:sialidase [Ilumatobacteraceae bacterium]